MLIFEYISPWYMHIFEYISPGYMHIFEQTKNDFLWTSSLNLHNTDILHKS